MPRVDHDLYRGTLDIVVLSLLCESSDHGYGLIERLKQRSSGALEISEGAVYPLLHRLEVRGCLECVWETTSLNRRAKRYLITDKGRRLLEERWAQWRALADFMTSITGRLTDETGAIVSC